MKLIAPSILSADFGRLAEEVRAVEKAGADWIHVDIMDGHFVPPITIGPEVVASVKRATKLPLDVHLMIENPDASLEAFVEAGANTLTVHQEACTHLDRTVNRIRELGAKPGIAVNPATALTDLEYALDLVDLVLIMTVNPGFGGQKFLEYCLPKVVRLKEMLIKHGRHDTLIEVDGGVKPDNVARLAEAGADVFVAGSAIFKSDDYSQTIAAFRKQIAV